MNHRDHVALIAGGVETAGDPETGEGETADDEPGDAEERRRRWLELGAGNGEFTLALAECIGSGDITAVDLDAWALSELEARVVARYREIRVALVVADFTHGLPEGPFDGVLAANSLHFVSDPVPVLITVRERLARHGCLIVVEYDSEHGNPYVPHPISAARLPLRLRAAGFGPPREIGRVPSRFLGAIYAAVARPATPYDRGRET